jgi:hypothetical protein
MQAEQLTLEQVLARAEAYLREVYYEANLAVQAEYDMSIEEAFAQLESYLRGLYESKMTMQADQMTVEELRAMVGAYIREMYDQNMTMESEMTADELFAAVEAYLRQMYEQRMSLIVSTVDSGAAPAPSTEESSIQEQIQKANSFLAENGILSPEITDTAELSCYFFDSSSGNKFDLRSLEKIDGDYTTAANDDGIYFAYNFCTYVDTTGFISHSGDGYAMRVSKHGNGKFQTDDSVSATDFSVLSSTNADGEVSVTGLSVTRSGGE